MFGDENEVKNFKAVIALKSGDKKLDQIVTAPVISCEIPVDCPYLERWASLTITDETMKRFLS